MTPLQFGGCAGSLSSVLTQACWCRLSGHNSGAQERGMHQVEAECREIWWLSLSRVQGTADKLHLFEELKSCSAKLQAAGRMDPLDLIPFRKSMLLLPQQHQKVLTSPRSTKMFPQVTGSHQASQLLSSKTRQRRAAALRWSFCGSVPQAADNEKLCCRLEGSLYAVQNECMSSCLITSKTSLLKLPVSLAL